MRSSLDQTHHVEQVSWSHTSLIVNQASPATEIQQHHPHQTSGLSIVSTGDDDGDDARARDNAGDAAG